MGVEIVGDIIVDVVVVITVDSTLLEAEGCDVT